MARPKKEAAANNNLSEIVEVLQAQGRGDLAVKLLADVVSRPVTVTADEIANERQEAQRSFQTEHDRQRAEPHQWVEFSRMGENDNVETVDIGAAGVMYRVRKGHRVPLPQSAINVMQLAVREGWDYGRPIFKDGKRFLRKIRESDYAMSVFGPCSPEEAAEWRANQAAIETADLKEVGRNQGEELLEVGAY